MAKYISPTFFSLLMLALASCSGPSLHPPYEIPIEQLATDSDSNAHWAFLYRSGNELLKNNVGDLGCHYFSELSADKAFPLATWAKIKKIIACRNKDEAVNFWKAEENKVPRWAKEYYFRQSYLLAKELQLRSETAYFASELSDYHAPKPERIALIKEAIALAPAEKHNDYRKKLLKLSPKEYLVAPKQFATIVTVEKKAKNKIPEELLIDLGLEFERERNFNQARVFYKLAIDSKTLALNIKNDAWKKTCQSYKLERLRPEFLSCFERHLKATSKLSLDNKDIMQLNLSYARALWTENRTDEAREKLNALLKDQMSSAEWRSKIHQAIAGIELEKKDYLAAAGQLQLALLEYPNNLSDERDQLFWRIGFTYYLNSDFVAAQNFWNQLAEKASNYNLRLQARFWVGRCLQRMEKADQAKHEFEKVAELDSYGYYGILAQRELRKEFSALTHLKSKLQPPKEMPTAIEWLIYLKEEEVVRRYLRFHSYQLQTEEEVEKAIPLFHHANAFDLSILLFYKFAPERRNEALDRLSPYIFPIPFADEISKVAVRFAIPQEYILAIIRQESAFNGFARSPADAFGLMQVIPEKAEVLSKKIDVPYQHFDDLYLSSINLPIGSYLLAENLKHYQGSYIAASAAYNAGDTPVARWHKDRYRGDILEFIESIPYEETQTYVKLVLRNMINYMRFTHTKPFLFDETLLSEFKLPVEN